MFGWRHFVEMLIRWYSYVQPITPQYWTFGESHHCSRLLQSKSIVVKAPHANALVAYWTYYLSEYLHTLLGISQHTNDVVIYRTCPTRKCIYTVVFAHFNLCLTWQPFCTPVIVKWFIWMLRGPTASQVHRFRGELTKTFANSYSQYGVLFQHTRVSSFGVVKIWIGVFNKYVGKRKKTRVVDVCRTLHWCARPKCGQKLCYNFWDNPMSYFFSREIWDIYRVI